MGDWNVSQNYIFVRYLRLVIIYSPIQQLDGREEDGRKVEGEVQLDGVVNSPAPSTTKPPPPRYIPPYRRNKVQGLWTDYVDDLWILWKVYNIEQNIVLWDVFPSCVSGRPLNKIIWKTEISHKNASFRLSSSWTGGGGSRRKSSWMRWSTPLHLQPPSLHLPATFPQTGGTRYKAYGLTMWMICEFY